MRLTASAVRRILPHQSGRHSYSRTRGFSRPDDKDAINRRRWVVLAAVAAA
jgi:hypothetical protein